MDACESQLEGLLSQGLERGLALPCPAATSHALQGFAAIGNPHAAEQVCTPLFANVKVSGSFALENLDARTGHAAALPILAASTDMLAMKVITSVAEVEGSTQFFASSFIIFAVRLPPA